MNLKEIGLIFIFAGLLIGITTTVMKVKDDAYINMIIDRNNGSCFLEDGTCLHAPQTVLPFLGGGLLSLTLFALGAYLLVSSRSREIGKIAEKNGQPAKEAAKVAVQKPKELKPDETLMFDKIIEAEGTIFQSELVEKTGFTKVKVTRLLDRLEGKGLIERKRRGMTNVVILKHKNN